MDPMLHIRKHVFRISQMDMAQIASVSQGTVSRWETGGPPPDRDVLARVRSEARRRKVKWDDRWFFETPAGAK